MRVTDEDIFCAIRDGVRRLFASGDGNVDHWRGAGQQGTDVLTGPGPLPGESRIVLADADCKATRNMSAHGQACALVGVSTKLPAKAVPIAGANSQLELSVFVRTGLQTRTILIDGSRGLTFSINAADGISINARMIPIDISAVDGSFAAMVPGQDLVLTCSAVWRAQYQPQRIFAPTKRIALVQNVASILIPIPDFAVDLTILTDTAGAAVTVEFLNAGALIDSVNFARTSANSVFPPPARGGADAIRLTSTAGATNASIIWALNL